MSVFVNVLFTVTVGAVAMLVFACMGMWERAGIILAVICVAVGGYFAANYAVSVKYNDKVVRYRAMEYLWSEVKVTLVFTHSKLDYKNYMYNLVFGDSFMLGDNAMNSLQNGFWVCLSKRNLKIVTQHCQDRIAIVHLDGTAASIDDLRFDKKNKQIIIDHNNKYFDKVKEMNGFNNEDL